MIRFVLQLEKIDDSIPFIKSRPKPLALYVFTKDQTLQRRMISETSSGSVTFNDAILQVTDRLYIIQFIILYKLANNNSTVYTLQYAADSLPFGGVGESGFGKYHGKFSFDTFSHDKAIVRRSFLTDFWFRFPPWSLNKFQLFEVAYNYDYFGLLLVLLGLNRSSKRTSVWLARQCP